MTRWAWRGLAENLVWLGEESRGIVMEILLKCGKRGIILVLQQMREVYGTQTRLTVDGGAVRYSSSGGFWLVAGVWGKPKN